MKYGQTLNIIFPNSKIRLEKNIKLQKLSINLSVTLQELEFIFYVITKSDSEILHEYFEKLSGPKIGEYWLSEGGAKEKVKRIQNEINFLKLDYH